MRIIVALAVAAGSLGLLVGSNLVTRRFDPQEQAVRKQPDVVKLAVEHKLGPVTFSHTNHATKNYGIDGSGPIACIECHHAGSPRRKSASTRRSRPRGPPTARRR